MGRKTANNSRPVALCVEDIAALTGGGPDRELIVTTYFVKTAFTGASVNDTITSTQIINTSDAPNTISTIWRNQTTGADLASAPSGTNLTLVGSQALTDAQLRASALVVSPNISRGAGTVDANTQRVTLASDGPTVTTLTSIDNKTPALIGGSVPSIKGQQLVSDCTISNGASLSAAVDLGVYRLVGISIPATFEPTTLTFQSSYDNVTWMNVYDSYGTEKSVSAGTSRRVILSPGDFYGVRYIRIRGGTSASPTTVAADRTVKLISEA